MYVVIIRQCKFCGLELPKASKSNPPRRFCSLACQFASHVNMFGPIPEHRPELGRCFAWVGSTSNKGYGSINVDGTLRGAHRVAFYLTHGRWPHPQALHKCDNSGCVRADHLFEGTNAENIADMHSKGRNAQPKGEAAGASRVSEEDVKSMRAASLGGESQRSIATRFGITKSTVGCLLRGDTWQHVPCSIGSTAHRRGVKGSKHAMAKLTEESVVEMRALRSQGLPLKQIAQRFGISIGKTSMIVRYLAWKHVA